MEDEITGKREKEKEVAKKKWTRKKKLEEMAHQEK